jgi:hypothetical protein
MTSRALTPMEPVDPNMEIFFIYLSRLEKGNATHARFKICESQPTVAHGWG